MKIKRRGSYRDHGSFERNLQVSFSWDKSTGSVKGYAFGVADFNTDAHHDWDILIAPEELASMIEAAAKGIGVDGGVALAQAFSTRIQALLKLAHEGVGQL